MYEIVIGRSEKDREEFGLDGTVLIGKHFVTMGRVTSLSNPVYLDVVKSHVVFVCGKRGGGKCLHGDTLITLNNGLRIPIKELKNNDNSVLGLDKNLKIDSLEKTEFFERNVNALLNIKLRSGKEIKLTPEHPLLTVKGWVPAYGLQEGSRIAAPIDTKLISKEMQMQSIYEAMEATENGSGSTKTLLLNKRLLDKLANSDIFWDEIVEIEPLTGEFTVYDISVPESHNFVANDIIVHNSYTMGVIAEGMANLPKEISQNLAIVILDTMGIYWTMKYPNKQDPELLDEWGMKAQPLDVVIYTPKGFYNEYKKKGIPTDKPFSIKPGEFTSADWCMTFEIDENSPIGVLITRIINSLKESGKNFSIDDVIKMVKDDKTSEQASRDAVGNMFTNAKAWGLFDIEGTPLKDIVKGGQVTVLDVSCYVTSVGGWGVKSLAIGMVAQKLFIERMIARKEEEYQAIHQSVHYFEEQTEEEKKKQSPMVWLIIDEAHEFLPREGKTTATDPLVTIMREGRQPGISLILASQQPGKINTDVMTQSDTVIAHRITAKVDTEALGTLMQSYMREGLDVQLDNLPRVTGAALVFDDTNEKMYPIRIRPRLSWHGGSAPTAIPPKKKKYFEM